MSFMFVYRIGLGTLCDMDVPPLDTSYINAGLYVCWSRWVCDHLHCQLWNK